MKLHSKQSVFFLVAIFVLVLIALGREGYRFFQVSQEIKDMEKKIENLKKENEDLTRTKDFYQSKEFLEQEVRQKLGYVKEGENVIIIASGQEDLEPEIQSQVDSQPKISIPKLWWNYFFKKQ